jgi:hypothetical protein
MFGINMNDILKDIENKMSEIETRMRAGELVIIQCKKQMRLLRSKLKEYKRLKEQVIIKSYGSSDGDL